MKKHTPYVPRALLLFSALGVLGLLSIPAACFFGSRELDSALTADFLLRFWKEALFGLNAGPLAGEEEKLRIIVTKIRLARVCLSYMAGAGLALAGVTFQGILRNPLADPFTLGISGGAALGAALAISFGVSALLLPFWALGGAALALFAVLILSVRGGLRQESLILAGVVVSAFLAALIALVKTLNEDSVSSIVFWVMGSFQNRTWEDVKMIFPFCIVGMLPLLLMRRELDLLSLGEDTARLLGLHAARARFILLLSASCLSAACVAVSGIVGFVGIIVPHFIRILQGPKHGALMINSALAGGILLLWADTLARSALPMGQELPVGVLTALLGGPFFCLILNRKNRAF
ncbi:MAG: iron ABC transporter permease [Deltaproteobacteria bacterium]|jgi:iron complex transport system permease protein|nr:iron ABC transporter permease [Deltaproteobacteria bacterium]